MKKLSIVGKISPTELSIKRCYLPGVKIVGDCPVCKKPFERDFGIYHISYPVVNSSFKESMYHYDDETGEECEFDVTVQLNLSLKIIDEE